LLNETVNIFIFETKISLVLNLIKHLNSCKNFKIRYWNKNGVISGCLY